MARSKHRRNRGWSEQPEREPIRAPAPATPDDRLQVDNAASVELSDYLAVLARRRWLVVGIMALSLVAALAYSLTRTPTYESTASVLVQPIAVEAGRTNIRPDQLVNLLTEREVVRSVSVAALVAEQLGSPLPVDRLLERLSVSVPEGTQVLQITYADPHPLRAQETAQTFADVYLEQRRDQALAEIERRSDDIRERMAQAQSELQRVNEVIAVSAPNSSELAVARSQRDLLVSQLAQQQSDLAEVAALSIDPGRIIGPARLPASPAQPSHPLNLGLGLALGTLLGVVAAFVRDRLDDRVRDGTDLEEAIDLPVLAALPALERKRRRRRDERLVLLEEPESLAAESFRRLRTNLLTLIADRRFTSLVITSAVPGEGKSTTAANLAVALAQWGRRVLLVSADLRLPAVHRLLALDNERGLSDVLSGDARLIEVLQRPDGVDNLDVLASGPTPEHPGDLLQSQALERLAARSDGRHDIVIFDAPPVLAVADGLTLSRLVDGVIFTVRAGMTTRQAVASAVEQVRAAGGHIAGAVVCDAPRSDESAFNPYRVPPLRAPVDGSSPAADGARAGRDAGTGGHQADPGRWTHPGPPKRR